MQKKKIKSVKDFSKKSQAAFEIGKIIGKAHAQHIATIDIAALDKEHHKSQAAMGVNTLPANMMGDCRPIKGTVYPLIDQKILPPKRTPTRFNAKKLKERHGVLWASIARQVEFDMLNQKQILNSKKNRYWCKVGDIPLHYTNTVSENAAFTAIVEMIKRGLL